MAMVDVRLQKLNELIRSLKMGRDSLIKEGRVDAARIIDQKLQEIQRGYDAVLRQAETEKQLKVLTRQAKELERTYLEPPAYSDLPTEMVSPVGEIKSSGMVTTPAIAGAVAQMKAKKKKRRR